jgi:HPt (histidine-containing phosphotransfer) domain-containing protein
VFIADNSALLERIEQAVAARNYQELRALLHAMKGSSVSMGTDRLTRACTDLGRLSDSELRLKAVGLARTLSEEFSSARSGLERYLREKRQSAG